MSIQLQDIVARLEERTKPLDLTEREFQILRFVARGFITKQIAHELGTTDNTVENQRAMLSKKLGAKTPAHMVWIACQRGLV